VITFFIINDKMTLSYRHVSASRGHSYFFPWLSYNCIFLLTSSQH